MALSQKQLFVSLFVASVLPLLAIYMLGLPEVVNFVLAILVLALDVLAFSTKLYMSFFMPFTKMKNHTAVLYEDDAFTMVPSGNAIISRRYGATYASAFVKIPSYRSATEMNQEEKVDFSRLFSRALTITNEPVKYATQLYVINKDEYISNIRNKLDEAEERYQNASVDKDITKRESERISGEVTMWHNLYDSVNKVRSQALEAFAMVSSEGGTEEEAVSLALQRADDVAAGVSSVFGVTATIVEGEELLRLIEPDHMIPLVTVSEQIREKSAAEGV